MKEIPAGIPKKIHVIPSTMRSNKVNGESKPVISVFISDDEIVLCNAVSIEGPSDLVYRPDEPLLSGAVAYVVTTAKVICR